MMTNIFRRLLSVPTQLLFLIIVPGFFLGFIFLFKPLNIVEFFDVGKGELAFNATIIYCVILGVLIISRVIMLILRNKLDFTWLKYSVWGFVELIVAAFFMALYFTLIYNGEYQYFDVVGRCFYYLIIILVFPYLILSLFVIVSAKTEKSAEVDGESSLIRFVDNVQKLKLAVSSDAVLYVKAEENYVRIKYLDNDLVKDYLLRNTMKALEIIMQKHGMVRCQRSFFVNPRHVKVLRKDKQGVVVAELDVAGTSSIPVSPKYYDALEKML